MTTRQEQQQSIQNLLQQNNIDCSCSRLNDRQTSIVYYQLIECKPIKDIATILGVSIKVVQRTIERMTKYLDFGSTLVQSYTEAKTWIASNGILSKNIDKKVLAKSLGVSKKTLNRRLLESRPIATLEGMKYRSLYSTLTIEEREVYKCMYLTGVDAKETCKQLNLSKAQYKTILDKLTNEYSTLVKKKRQKDINKIDWDKLMQLILKGYPIKGCRLNANNVTLNPSKYSMSWDNKYFASLYKQQGQKSIGSLAVNQLQAMCGMLEQKTIASETIKYGIKQNGQKASLIFENNEYTQRVLTKYNQIDKNSAYPYWLKSHKMPTKYLGTKSIEGVECIEVYEYNDGTCLFDYDPFESPKTIHYYQAEYYGNEFVEYWQQCASIDNTHKRFAKSVMVAAIGAITRYTGSIIGQYIWWLQKTHIEQVCSNIEALGGTVIKCHTDSIGWIGNIDTSSLDMGASLGQWKMEHDNTSIFVVSAGTYQVEGHLPKLSGIRLKTPNKIELIDGTMIPLTTTIMLDKLVGKQVLTYLMDGNTRTHTIGQSKITWQSKDKYTIAKE